MTLLREKLAKVLNSITTLEEDKEKQKELLKEYLIKLLSEKEEDLTTFNKIEKLADIYELFITLVKLEDISLQDVLDMSRIKRNTEGTYLIEETKNYSNKYDSGTYTVNHLACIKEDLVFETVDAIMDAKFGEK